MMKYVECSNAREKKAFLNIKEAANFILGGLENDLEDNLEDDEEYIKAKNTLADHALLVNMLYNEATSGIFTCGSACWNGDVVKRELREINFLGKEWLMERCEERITREGY